MKGLSYKQQKAINLLVYSNYTNKSIAEQIGITEQTLYNWLNNAIFSLELSKQRATFFNHNIKGFKYKWSNIMQQSIDIVIDSLWSEKDGRLRLNTAKKMLKMFKPENFIEEQIPKNELNEIDDDELFRGIQAIVNSTGYRKKSDESQS